MEGRKAEEWGRAYVEKLSLYEEFTMRVKNLVQDLIGQEDIMVYGIQGSAKNPDEFISELAKRDEGELSSLGAFQDLSQVRILLHFPEDVRNVEKILQQEFLVDLAHSVTTSSLVNDPERFGYPSISYVVSLSNERSRLREWSKYRDLKCTVLVRTVIQEAWATISPKVSTTATDTLTQKKLKRKLIRLSALLEEADEGFLALWDAAKDSSVLVAPSRTEPVQEEEKQSQVLSQQNLADYFKEHKEIAEEWAANAVKAGFPAFYPTEEYLAESFTYLYDMLQASEIKTIEDLDRFIKDIHKNGLGMEQLESIVKAFEKENANWRVDGFSALFLLLLNMKWDVLQEKDLVALNVKKGSDRIKGLVD
ncbi:MAG: RelA/SpoT domain-containing protein [Aminobacterium sp.]|jgi:ppGpp synthetase/RelA/SpoT-type nucleotidyltranferase|nr:RelA/SpoT domain-containing protein [Aminobacterium sp.]MDD3708483.1 RelA/SpoT domain-containing protein [Aminobacterium sp.]MDD4229538.1 RelA/SpoT domain-containing protein [Aminobacterium sp.]MDD4552081.1 RelA/SpoT domain-containing protein [Aminobacterium sp.]